ncbi:MAG TPA: hypothetical protein EYG03_16775 [Planctomycetes bacterium]|nr:hypothetical protein [Fuerstiella sp.]HIK93604.1 hypothetical protein [Planctomycetota bacterium]
MINDACLLEIAVVESGMATSRSRFPAAARVVRSTVSFDSLPASGFQIMNSVFAGLKRAGYVLVNFWLAFHVFAIFISPAGMPPASPLLVDASRVAMPYNQLLFLNHGYHFFAPDPGASTLISWSIDRPGDTPLKGRFPDPDTRPRLLYHRYFMLAENIGAFPLETQGQVFEAYARHFARRHDSPTISLSRLRHRPSSIPRVLAGGQLSDFETFVEEPIGFYDFRTGNSEATGTATAAASF